MRANVRDPLHVDGVLYVLDLLLVDHVVEEEEVDPGSGLSQNFDQFKVIYQIPKNSFGKMLKSRIV